MTEPATTLAILKAFTQHAARWLANLRRAGQDRQNRSLSAVNQVVSLARKTRAYARGVRAGQQDFRAEGDLAAAWSDLAFELRQLGLGTLAKKCDLSSRFWADPQQFPPGFLDEADIRFDSIERLARQIEASIVAGQRPA